MTITTTRAMYWAPRALGLLYAGFLGLFALDAFSEGRGFIEAAGAFAIHLIPAAAMLTVVLIAWRYELAGALLLCAAGIWYAVIARSHPSWILLIAGPVFVLAALFVVSRLSRGVSRQP